LQDGRIECFPFIARSMLMMASCRTEFHVPTVDIKPYILNPSSPEAAEVVAEVSRACKTTGFFQLVGHGISSELQDLAFRSSAAFFALPSEEKATLLRDKDGGALTGGYEVLGSQGSENGKLPDLSEVRSIKVKL
jgi:isopenicillin N synthase-like dioxygenase